MEASNCFRKVDPLQAVDCIMKATNIYTDMGRFGTAAKHHMTIAEIYETDCIDVEKAIQNYEKAADYFDGEQSNSSTNKCRVKIAHLYAQMGQYDKACKIFEAVGRAGMESKLLQYGAKEYFFKAAICQLCVDAGQAANALQQYQEGFPAFGDSRECKLLQKLIAAIEADEVEAYQSALQDFDGVSRMEPFLTSLFLKIKKARFSDEADIC